jgi:hypothetical protein
MRSKYGVDRQPLNGISLKGEGQPNGRHKVIEVNGVRKLSIASLHKLVHTVSYTSSVVRYQMCNDFVLM